MKQDGEVEVRGTVHVLQPDNLGWAPWRPATPDEVWESLRYDSYGYISSGGPRGEATMVDGNVVAVVWGLADATPKEVRAHAERALKRSLAGCHAEKVQGGWHIWLRALGDFRCPPCTDCGCDLCDDEWGDQ